MTEKLEVIILAKDETGGAFGSVAGNLQNIGKIALGVAGGGIAALTTGIVALGTKAIPAASDLNESINAVNVVFGDSAEKILAWGQTAADTAGLSQAEFAQMAAQTGAMLQNFGLSTEVAADQTTALAQRAADMASIFNTDVNDALTAIQAGLRGEANPLERFGVNLSAAAVKAHAMAMGLAETESELDSTALTTARLSLLMEQTNNIAGDFVNTSDQLANATRVQQARWQNFMAQLGSFALPTIQLLQGAFMDIAEQVMPLVIGAVERLQPFIEGLADIFVTFIKRVADGRDPIDAFGSVIHGIAEIFGATEEQAEALKDGFFNLISSIQEFMEPIIAFITEHVTLKDVMIALAIALASVVIPAVLSLAASLLPIIAVGAALVAAVVLVRKAWESNWLGIRDKLQEVWAALGPIFETIREWLATNIPIAIETLKNFWENVLLPAIQKVWTFLTVDMMPIWEALAELLQVTVGTAITILTGLWENVLQPALQSIWQWIQEKIIPVFEEVWRWLQNKLQPAFSNVGGIIQRVAGWIEGLASAIGNLPNVLPDWLTPGSPTPFELGLRGISDALKEVNRLALPQFAGNLSMMAPAVVGAQQMIGVSAPTGTAEYHLHIHTSGPVGGLSSEFETLKALAKGF